MCGSCLEPSRTTPRTAATVWLKSRSVESTTVTPGAAVRKSTTWESEASRRCSASATDAASCVVSSALRRAARTSGAAVRRIRTGASGATTVVMSRPSTTTPGRPDAATSARKSALTDLRIGATRATPLTASVTRGSRIASVTSVVARPGPSTSSGSSEMRVVEVAGDVEQRRRVGGVGAVRERVPGEGPVRGARVEVAVAELARGLLRDARLAAAGRSVDRDDDRARAPALGRRVGRSQSLTLAILQPRASSPSVAARTTLGTIEISARPN